jgi:hypothetical protein
MPALKAINDWALATEVTFLRDTSDKTNQQRINATFAAGLVQDCHWPKENPQGLKPGKFIAEYRRHECLLHPVMVHIHAENSFGRLWP